jgi:hypothetical protein
MLDRSGKSQDETCHKTHRRIRQPAIVRAVLNLEDARVRLDPFRQEVFAAPAVAAVTTWQRFVEAQPDLASPLDETARANVIHCWWRHEVRRSLTRRADVREVRGLGYFAVAVGTNLLVRFKSVSSGVPANVATEQQKRLAYHRYDTDAMAALELDGITEPPTALTCGYSVDAATVLQSVEIRCDHGNQNLWRWMIWGAAAAGGGSVEQLPLPGTDGPKPARILSARKKEADSEEASSE